MRLEYFQMLDRFVTLTSRKRNVVDRYVVLQIDERLAATIRRRQRPKGFDP